MRHNPVHRSDIKNSKSKNYTDSRTHKYTKTDPNLRKIITKPNLQNLHEIACKKSISNRILRFLINTKLLNEAQMNGRNFRNTKSFN